MQATFFIHRKTKVMKKYSLFVGVDISKNSLDICLLSADNPKEMSHHVIANSQTAINRFLRTLPDSQSVLVCMEDTGAYGMPLCYALEAGKWQYSVVPAIHIKRSKGLKRGKSDKTDAKDIAFYALTHGHEIKLSSLPEADLQELKLLLSERDKLVAAIKLFESTQESNQFLNPKATKELDKCNKKTTNMLRKQLCEIEKIIAGLCKQSETIDEQMGLLQSIPGIGPQTALLLISYTRCFSSFDNWRQLACYAGIAPFPYQSGSSIKGRTKVSHFAQKRLKSAIHLAALSSKRYDTEMSAYFERKVAEGKNKMLVLNAVRCKLIARAFAVINRKTPFVNTQKFAA